MSTLIEGREGTYDLAVTYYDESDGNSWSEVLVDGERISSWTWNATGTSTNAGPESRVTRIIRDVELDDLARITIRGTNDGDEPLRLDTIQLLRAQSIVEADNNPAFEGAEGFGADTIGGRGGIVIKVTNLKDSGEGSLRWALEELDFARVVVFEVGGLIKLKDQINVNGDVTVAGETAPGGVTVTGGRIRIVESDVIIKGMRFRPDDNAGQDPAERDAITIGTSERVVERVILDSNSFTWAVDENISIWSGARNITISNNIIAEGLNNSIHPDGAHSMGLVIGDGAKRVTIADNLFASNFHRNPQLIGADQIEFVNNVVSNWGNNGFHTAVREGEPIRANVIGNVFLKGTDTSDTSPVRLRGWEDGTKYAIYDNIGPGRKDGDPESWILQADTKQGIQYYGSAFAGSDVSIQSSKYVVGHVLENVGARTNGELDAIDARIVSEVKFGTGDIINRPNENLSEIVTYHSAEQDTDEDGIPDVFEKILGSDPNSYDPHGDSNGNSWLNIEEYFAFRGGEKTTVTAPPQARPANADILVQAESLTLVDGFKIRSNGNAEGGKLIQAGDGGVQKAKATFDGDDGAYDIVLNYWDENDGESEISVLVNGAEVDAWVWDAGTRSPFVNDRSRAEHRIGNIDLQTGDVVELVGYLDGNEPLRIDYFEFNAII